jgi:hypothetical protein
MNRFRSVSAACIATAALVVAAGCGGDNKATTASQESPVAGSWKGTLHQSGLQPFKVRATVRSPTGTVGNQVHYTGIDCSGRWTYLRTVGSSYRFREVIERGEGGKCKGVGVVSLTPVNVSDDLRYGFRGGGVTSEGVLHPVR